MLYDLRWLFFSFLLEFRSWAKSFIHIYPLLPQSTGRYDLESIIIYFIRNAYSLDGINQKQTNHLCHYISVLNKHHYLGLKRIHELLKLVLISGVKAST